MGTYTWDEMNTMLDNGNWMGGFIDGYGYFGQEIVVTGCFRLTGAHPDDPVIEKSWAMKILMSSNTTMGSFIPDESKNAFADAVAAATSSIVSAMETFGSFVAEAVAVAAGADNKEPSIYIKKDDPMMDKMQGLRKVVMSQRGVAGNITDAVGNLTYEYVWKNLIEQGNDHASGMNGSMGKGGNYSFWGQFYGY